MPEDDAALAVAYCEAYEGERNADDVLALMTEDAVVVDMTLGVEYTGPDEIRAWIEDDPAFSALDVMTCSEVDLFLVYCTPVEGEPSAPVVVSDADFVVQAAYCQVCSDRDEDAFLAVVTDDFVRYTVPPGLLAAPYPGVDGFRTWATQTEAANPTVDCPELGVGNGLWIASTAIWSDVNGEEATGGIDVVEAVDGKANRHYVRYSDVGASPTEPEA